MYSKKMILKILKTCKIRAIWNVVWKAFDILRFFVWNCLFVLFVDCSSWKYLTAACAAQVAKRVVLFSFQHGYTFRRARCPFRNGGLATILVHLYLNFLNHVRYVYKDVVLIHFPSQVYGGFSFRVVLAACFGLQLVWTSVPSPLGSNWQGEIYHNSSRITRFLFRFCVSIQWQMTWCVPLRKSRIFCLHFVQCLSHHRCVQGFLVFVQQQFWDLLCLFIRVLAQHNYSRVTGFSFGTVF